LIFATYYFIRKIICSDVLSYYENTVGILWAEQQRAEEDTIKKIVEPVKNYVEVNHPCIHASTNTNIIGTATRDGEAREAQATSVRHGCGKESSTTNGEQGGYGEVEERL
jgi:hypothetical protein